MSRFVSGMILLFACEVISTAAQADEGASAEAVVAAPIEIDRSVLGFETEPDAKLITALGVASETKLLANLGISVDQNGRAVGPSKKILVFHCDYELRSEQRRVFVYDARLRGWPGTQPQTILICDASLRLLYWKEVGGSPMFERAALEQRANSPPILLITCRHRHTIPNPERGVYRFSLEHDRVEPLPEVLWLYKGEAERAR